jgi:hypothetical protein
MGSEIGRWMLENNLTEYYSESMTKDLREAAAASAKSRTLPMDTLIKPDLAPRTAMESIVRHKEHDVRD